MSFTWHGTVEAHRSYSLCLRPLSVQHCNGTVTNKQYSNCRYLEAGSSYATTTMLEQHPKVLPMVDLTADCDIWGPAKWY